MVNVQPTPGARRLAQRLRELREREFKRLTQSDLGQALGDDEALSPATISMWENPSSGRLPPPFRLEAYARLFCTPRSFEGGEGVVRMLDVDELTEPEQDRMEELQRELLALRSNAGSQAAASAPGEAQSMWHFPDGSRITLVCYRLPEDRQPEYAEKSFLNYVRFANLADLDTLIDVYGAIRAYNPTSRIVITAAQELTQRDVSNHLVLIGGLAWETVTPWFSRFFSIPIEARDPGERGTIVVRPQGGEEREFKYTLTDGKLVEDVGFFVRGENPLAPRRTLTICGGITTRGVRGAAGCFIDWEMRERNDRWLMPRFPEGSTYCIVMRVPVVNDDPLVPDLSKEENRLFEWDDVSTKTE
jgi:hypothetical protein